MQKILVVGPAWVGDMVMTQSLFKALHNQYPGVVIDVLAPTWSGPILERMPEVRQHIIIPVKHGEFGLLQRFHIGKQLRTEKYNQAIVIPRSWKSALVPYFARIPLRTGYKGEMRFGLLNDIRPLDKSRLTQTVQRYVALANPRGITRLLQDIPFPALKIDTLNQQQLISKFSINTARPVVAFMPGAEYGPAKRWPVEYFARLGKALVAQEKQVWLLGSDKDQAVCGKIHEMVGNGITDLSGQTQLVDVVDLMGLVDCVITNDSGLMHVAAATNRNIIAIYGSSTPAYTPPLSDTAEILYLNLECSPCFARTCKYGHYQCLTGIKPNEILLKLQS